MACTTQWTWVAVTLVAAMAVAAQAVELSNSRPNILFILSDDLGWAEVGTFPAKSPHGRIATPNLDQFTRDGIQFLNGVYGPYAATYAGEAVCAPSRCTLMTGLHTGHAYIRGNMDVDGHDLPLPADTVTFPKVLQQAGYWTGMVGKWGLGYNGTTGAPRKQGFSYYYGQLDQANCHNMYPPFVWENERQLFFPTNANASRTRCMAADNTCVWSHALFTNQTMRVLRQRAQHPDQPFFLQLSYTDPHAGGWYKTFEMGNPVPSDGRYASEPWPNVERDHASVIGNFQDRDVGSILRLLDDLGLAENTLVIFASDNGADNEGGHNYRFFDSTGPLRGYKRSLYDGGIRSPSLIQWKGTIDPQRVSTATWAFWDLPANLDGMSLVPLLEGRPQPDLYSRPLYWEFCTDHSWGHAVRLGDWKAVSFAVDQPLQLYNITADIGEQDDLAAQFPAVVRLLADIAKAEHTPSALFPIHNCVSS